MAVGVVLEVVVRRRGVPDGRCKALHGDNLEICGSSGAVVLINRQSGVGLTLNVRPRSL